VLITSPVSSAADHMHDFKAITFRQRGFGVGAFGHHFHIALNGDHAPLQTQLGKQLGDAAGICMALFPIEVDVHEGRPRYRLPLKKAAIPAQNLLFIRHYVAFFHFFI